MRNLIEQAFEAYKQATHGDNMEENRYHWMMGFASCLGVLGGTIEAGVPPQASPFEVFKQMVEELQEHAPEIAGLQELERRKQQRGWN